MPRPTFKLMVASALLGAASAALAQSPLHVFACEPEWAALVKALAPQAQVFSATHARQDPHHIEARPALIAALRRAQLAVCTGASLEAGWLPMLQQRAGNAAVRDGQPGMFYAANHVTLEGRRERVGWNEGDVHPEGNPHFQLDPARMAQVAQALAQRLAQIDPAQASAYQQQHAQWQAQWQQHMASWRQRAAPLKGQRVVAQHNSLAYLWQWLGMQQVADLEPKPGLPPTPAHLQAVLAQTQAAPPAAVVHTLYQEPQPAQWLSRQLGPQRAPVLALPSAPTADGPAATLHGWMHTLIDTLLAAVPPSSEATPAAPAKAASAAP
ncbi:MAG: zinc ABC transporter substrate-binding protein [Pseudomonadota bacterium]|nr:zinc ABC transporter substrate-binding protein [Pseudomonadota bacterium]